MIFDARAKFTGISPDTLAFLEGPAANNNKPWFEEHRPEYQANLLGSFRRLPPAYHFLKATSSP